MMKFSFLNRYPFAKATRKTQSLPHTSCSHQAKSVSTCRCLNAGFTITELLFVVALVGLLTMAVAAGIGVAINAYTQVRAVSEAQAVYRNAVTAVEDELRFAYAISEVPSGSANIQGAKVWAFDSTTRGYRLFLSNSSTDNTGIIMLNGIDLSEGVDKSAASAATPLPLVNTGATGGDSKASTQTYTAHLTTPTWDATTGIWTFALAIYSADGTRVDAINTTTTHTVRAVNNW